MKKDKEWLKEEVYKLIEGYISFGGHEHTFITGANVNKLGVLIDQLDEPEVEQLDKKIKELDSCNDELIRDNNQLRNALDNQEVLSQEWIDEHEQCITGLGTHKYGVTQYHYTPFVSVQDLQKLLVPKQEEVDRAHKDGYEKGKKYTFYKGYLEGLADKESEPETVADVLADFHKSLERLKKVLGTKVEETTK